MAGSADITGRQNYVMGIGHPRNTPSSEAAPAMVSSNAANGSSTLLAGGNSYPLAKTLSTLIDPTRPKGGLGTLITSWATGLSGQTSSADVNPEPSAPAGVVAQISQSGPTTYAAADAGSQSSAMNCAGFWAKAAKRASGQIANVFNLEFGTDSTFANCMRVAVTVRCDGKWRFYTTPAQVAWGTSGTFTIGTTAFTHVQVRESLSLATGSGRPAMASGESIQIGNVYRDPSAKPFAYVRLDDGVLDQYVPRLSLSTPFVGISGVTIPQGVPQSALSLVQAFGLKATCYVLTRHIGDTANGFLTAAQLRDLQDNYGWDIGFQSHANPLSGDNRGLRLLGPDGFNVMPVGQISAVNTGTGAITSATHNIGLTSGIAGNQGYPVTLIGSGLPAPVSGSLSAGDTVWLRNVTTTTFTMHRTEADSCSNVNPITFSSSGTPANWGYRYAGSANDSSAIAADFATGQAALQAMGFKAWRHYAMNQGAYDINTEAAIVALRTAGNMRTVGGTFANSGIAQNSYIPRIAIGHMSAGIGGTTTTPQGTSVTEWLNLPTAIDTHASGVDAQTAIRTFVDDLVKRGGIAANYHHHFSTEASMRNFCAYLDQVKLRADQGLLSTGTVSDLWNLLDAAGTA